MKTLFFSWFLLLSVAALAQDDFYKKEQPKPTRRQYVITLQDGSQLRGELVRQDSVEAVIKTGNLGQVTVKANQIQRMVAIDADGDTPEGYPNIFPQYLIVSPTAYQAEPGKLYYRTVFAVFSQFDYGISKNWSVGVGFLTFDPTILFSVKTKVSFPVGPRVRLGIQGQIGSSRALLSLRSNNLRSGITYLQGVASFGTPQRNVTVAVGSIRVFDRFSSSQLLTVGTVQKISPSLTFLGEINGIIGDYVSTNASVSAGLRFDRRKHSFDLSASFSIPSGGGFPITPVVAYQLRISK